MQDRAASAASPDALSAAAATRLGISAMNERREEDVLPQVAAAAKRFPRDAALLHVLGLLYRAVGDLRPALVALDQAARMASNNATLAHARARATLEAGLPSLPLFDHARRLAPMDGEVILGHAAALLAEGRASQADTMLTDMLRQHPGWLDGHPALARLRFAGGGRHQWLAELDRAIAGAPRDFRLHHLKVMLLHRAGFGDQARHALGAGLAQAGAAPPLVADKAMVLAEVGTSAEADAAFAMVDPLAEPDLAVHWLRHLLRRGEPERVSGLAGKLKPEVERDAWPYLSLAWRLLGDARAAWLDDPMLVRVVDLDETDHLDELANTLEALHMAREQPYDQSVRGGTQTDGPLFSRVDPVLQRLRHRLSKEVRAYIEALPTHDPRHPLLGRVPRHPRFVGSWSVRLRGSGWHDPHVHTEGWLSSAFYVRLPQPEGAPHAGWLCLGEPQPTLSLGLGPLRMVEPRPGRLVLFPSTLWHGTRPFAAGERLTVAFDIA